MKLDDKKKRLLLYGAGALGVLAVVWLALRNRSSGGGEANTVYVRGASSGGGGGGSFIPSETRDTARSGGGVVRYPGEATLPGAPAPAPSPCEGRRTLPCLVPPCPCAGDDGQVIIPTEPKGGDRGGIISIPGVVSPSPGRGSLTPGPRLPPGGFVGPVPPGRVFADTFENRNDATRGQLATAASDDAAQRPALRPYGVRARAGQKVKLG